MNKVLEYVIEAKDKTKDALSSATSGVKSFASSVATNLANIKAGFEMAWGVAQKFASIFGAAIKEAFRFEKVQSDFSVLLNSVDDAKAHIADLRAFASSTPLTFDDLAAASKQMLSFGISVDDVMPSLKMLGDIAMGDSEKFKGLSLVFAQVKSAGKLMGQDLMQMINQGFNPLTIIAQQTGQSMSELKDIMAQGGISFEMVAEAMRVATSEGGLFNGAMASASQTGEGLVSTMQDKWSDVVRQFGEAFTGSAKGGIQIVIDKLTELVESGEVEVWAKRMAGALEEVAAVAESTGKAISWLYEKYAALRNLGETVGNTVGAFVGTLSGGGSLGEAIVAAGTATAEAESEQNARAYEEYAIRMAATSATTASTAAGTTDSPLVKDAIAAVDAVKTVATGHAKTIANMMSSALSKSVEKADTLIQTQLKSSISNLQKESANAQSALDSAQSRVDALMGIYMNADDPYTAYQSYNAQKSKENNAWRAAMRDISRLEEGENTFGSNGYLSDDLARDLRDAIVERDAAAEYARLTAERLEDSVKELAKINAQLEQGRAD